MFNDVEFDKVDHDSHIPLYEQIMDQVRARIRDGRLRPGQELPTEGVLVSDTGASRISVRRALQDLQSYGEVVKKSGMPTRVAEAWDPDLVDPVEAGAPWGDDVSVVVDETHPASGTEAVLLGCDEGDTVHRWEGIDYLDMRPARLRTSLILLPDRMRVDEGVVVGDPLQDAATLEAAAVQGWTSNLGARVGAAQERSRLELDEDQLAVLVDDRLYVDMEGETVAAQQIVLPGQKYRVAVGFDL